MGFRDDARQDMMRQKIGTLEQADQRAAADAPQAMVKDTPKNNCYVLALSSGVDGVVPFWVEGVASYRQFCHFGGGDLDAFLVGPRIEYALDLQARLRCGGADQLDDGDPIHQRFSSQFWVMWQKRRCSILFHFEVPGGK